MGPGARGSAFSIEQRVYYQHTDAGGVVYHGNYLAFLEACRTELLHSLGFNLAELANKRSVLFIVHRLKLEFRRPARLHEMLRISATPSEVGRASVAFDQEVSSEGQTLVSASVRLACVHPGSWRPVPIPDDVRTELLELRPASLASRRPSLA